MVVEVRCEYQKKPKNEYVTMKNIGTGESHQIKSPNETWKSNFTVEVADGTKADELIKKVEKHMVEKSDAIQGTVVVKKLIKLEIIKI